MKTAFSRALVLLALSALPLGLPGCVSWVQNTRIAAGRAACASHLGRIGAALKAYRLQEETDPPLDDPTTMLQALYDGGFLEDPRVVVCPATHIRPAAGLGASVRLARATVGYAGYPPDVVRDATHGLPVLWDDRPRHYGARNVLFLDGHVETLLETEFAELVPTAADPDTGAATDDATTGGAASPGGEDER